MSSITTDNAGQYGDSRKLAVRARLHSEYTIAETGWFPWVAAQLPLKPGDRVLDIGCGPGWFWTAVANLLPEQLDLTLADLSPGMVDEAVARCSALSLSSVRGKQADAAALPFEDGDFDLVIAMHMLYHLPDPAAGIAEMWRVLKPGGFLAVTTNGIGNMREIYRLTAVFGSAPTDPAAEAFGYEAAERLMRSQFGNVAMSEYPASLRITKPEDVFLALTSYPPGEGAGGPEIASFRQAIAEAFRQSNGVLEVRRESALFLSRKTA
ncbi:methylase involved in ubiquinone/menaquinone biosynthesis [Rhizobium leguminosarum bv. trifolii WSM2297]|uniref:Methylase involved in ubiquinone/menaquinone biosynthesis n=1 Tax=Rhizobium leguminosarum bv. trifolii WSM2297 TaxID=754762 RepID=J0CJV6_RHILT|nr:class I SAM-dependent methyltransferase [Rhizobium leguminosarum]EJC79740.1 methylase involved in ubiquinone/menaquinone biosynthesis [Rhizobium leguminosarum bv. trifolii WSM2297]